MATASFFKTKAELEHLKNTPNYMHKCEGVYTAYQTDPEILAKTLPKPLVPVMPVVMQYVISINDPNFYTPYTEAALMTPAHNGDQVGVYMYALLLENGENGTFMGRDNLSIPKKNAKHVKITRDGQSYHARVTRHNVDILTIDGKIGEYNDPAMGAKVFAGREPGAKINSENFFYKYAMFSDENGLTHFSDVRLIDNMTTVRFDSWEPATATITLRESIDDPWFELPVVKTIGAGWTTYDMDLVGAKTLPVEDEEDALRKSLAARYDHQVFG